MTYDPMHQNLFAHMVSFLTDGLTATWQLNCRKLFLVVFLESGAELSYKVRSLDCKGFNIYARSLAFVQARAMSKIPAITSASCKGVSDSAGIHVRQVRTSPGGAPSTKEETVASSDMLDSSQCVRYFPYYIEP